jgi:dolichyl-phosphate beta-glucosyltransferase
MKPLPLPSLLEDEGDGDVQLTVVVPAYNEVARLPSMLTSTIDHLKRSGTTYEILIVDDGSSDGTSSLALEFAQQHPDSHIRVVVLEKNLGKGGAVRHGMLHSRGRRLLMADADGASKFEDLDLLWNAMDHLTPSGAPAVVVGSRDHLVKTEAVVKVYLPPNSTSSLHAKLT